MILVLILLMVVVSCSNKTEKELVKFENGNIKLEAQLIDGKREGIVKYYYESGELQAEQMWKDGVRDGFSKGYYKNGQLMQVDTFCIGSPCGLTYRYFENGNVKSYGQYQDGHQVGRHVFYYENGETREIDFYDSLGRPFDFIKFDPNGVITPEKRTGLFLTSSDTIMLGEEWTLVGYIGNNQNRTRMIIGRNFISEHQLSDTIDFYYPPEGLDDGIEYKVKPENSGKYVVEGIIQDRIMLENDYVKVHSIPFTKTIYVME